MPNNIGYPLDETPDLVSVDTGTATGGSSQLFKLAQSAEGSEALIQADQYGLLTQASILQGATRVKAAVTDPLAIDISNGLGPVSIVPVVTVENPSLTISGSVSITGSVDVSGSTLSAKQGTPGASSSAWTAKVSDGAQSPHLTFNGSNYILDGNIVDQNSALQADKSGFAEGSSYLKISGDVLADASAQLTVQNQGAAPRITPYRALHVSPRANSDGSLVTPFRTQKLGIGRGVQWNRHYGFIGASPPAGVPIFTPDHGRVVYIAGMVITFRVSGSAFKLFEAPPGTNPYGSYTPPDSGCIYNGTPHAGSVRLTFAKPIPLSAPDYVVALWNDSAGNGDIFIWGYTR